MSTYSVEVYDQPTNGGEVYIMSLETKRTHKDAARKTLKNAGYPVNGLQSLSAMGGDHSTRSNDRFYSLPGFGLEITVWKHS